GIMRMDGRRFDTHRVAVNNPDTTPIQQPVLRSAVTMRGDSMRPVATPGTQPTVNPAADPTHRSVTQREVISRSFGRSGDGTRPNAERRSEVNAGAPTLRTGDVNGDRTARPDRFNRDAGNQNAERSTNRVAVPPDASRVTNRNTDTNERGSTEGNNDYRRPDRNVDRNVDRNANPSAVERPVTPRNTEQPSGDRTERPQRPIITFGDSNRNDNRREENRRDANPPEYAPRRTETERREAAPRRAEEPPRYEAPRQEPPREYRREERPERYERPTPPPPRQEAPRYEPPRREAPPRQETPRYEPPPRQEAPRQEARPSPPPSNNGGGGDRTERPTRRPNGN
ncbi:MAG TPA: hypothetical protein VFZ34_23075, partial [Blastocatellia bacterium]|nr:hypothetical protein [Blastocatellia bacterium]